MRLFRIVVLAAFLVCVGCSSTTTALKMTAPAYVQRYTENYQGVVHKRLLRTYESTENGVEDRVNLGKFTDAIKVGPSNLKNSARLKAWLLSKQSGVDVLNKLKLGNTVEAALKSTKLDMLLKYVDKFNKDKIPTERISVVGSLMEKYGDDAVMIAIVRAKQVESTKAVATKLETDLVLNYVAIFNGKKDPEKLLNALMKDFGGKKSILSMIGVAKKEPLTKGKVKELTELETTVLVQYMERQLNKLPLDGKLETILTSQNLGKLDRGFSRMSTEFPDNDISFLRILTAKYGDKAVAKGLVDAKAVESTKDIATKMQTQQFEAWVKDGKSVDDVFKLLNLNQYRDALIISRGLDTLEGYITLFNREKSARESFIGILSAHFSGENKFALKLQEAMVADQLTKSKAIGLQEKLFQKWKDEGLDSVSILSKKFSTSATEVTTDPGIPLVANAFKTFLEKPRTRVNNVANGVNPARS